MFADVMIVFICYSLGFYTGIFFICNMPNTGKKADYFDEEEQQKVINNLIDSNFSQT